MANKFKWVKKHNKKATWFGKIKDDEIKKEIKEKTEDIIVYKKKNTKKVKAGIKKSELKNIETMKKQGHIKYQILKKENNKEEEQTVPIVQNENLK